jgi:hypothetical protein
MRLSTKGSRLVLVASPMVLGFVGGDLNSAVGSGDQLAAPVSN